MGPSYMICDRSSSPTNNDTLLHETPGFVTRFSGPPRQRCRAVSLVEVLVAVAIVAVVFIPVFSLFMAGVEATTYTEDRLRAFSIAKRQIEAIRHANTINRLSHEQLTAAFADSPGFQPYMVDDRYEVTTEVNPHHLVEGGGRQAEVTYVKVTVRWTIAGTERSLVLDTFLDRSYH